MEPSRAKESHIPITITSRMKTTSIRLSGLPVCILLLIGMLGSHLLPAKTNFIVLLADDISPSELSCYGNVSVSTPHLDQLAEEGVQFDTAWATPLCSPTRAMTMTGRYATRTGWWHNMMRPREPLSDKNRIFAEVLQENGYATAVCGKWQLPGTPKGYGFDEYCLWKPYKGFDGQVEGAEVRGKPGSVVGRVARYWHPSIVQNGKPVPTSEDDYGPDIFADFVLDFAKRHQDQPFLIYYPMLLPHASWDFERGVSGYLPTPLFDEEGNRIPGRSEKRTLGDNARYIDALVGRIIAGLKKLDLEEDTVFIFAGDNGSHGKGRVNSDIGPRVPLIVWGPGQVTATGHSSALVSLADIYPTLMDIAEIPLPKDYTIDGISFASVLRGNPKGLRDHLLSYCSDFRQIRTSEWLLDGYDHLYYCGEATDDSGYVDMTNSDTPEANEARERLLGLLTRYPAPTKEEGDALSFHSSNHTVKAPRKNP